MPQSKYKGVPKSALMPPDIVRQVHFNSRRFQLVDAPFVESEGLTVFVNPPLKGIALSSLSGEELDALERFWLAAFALARPLVEESDRQAEEAMASGARNFQRMYRPAPIEYIREEPKPEKEEKSDD